MGKAAKGKAMSEAEFLANYARITAALDVMVLNGVLNSLDNETIEAYSAMSADGKK